MICDPISDYTAGVLVSTWRFARMLKERGHTIIFVAATSPDDKNTTEENGFKMYRFRSVTLPKTEGAWRISMPRRKQLRELFLQEKIDIVHLLVPMPSAFIAAQAAHDLGIPVLAHSHAQPENAFMHLPIKFLRPPLNAGFDAYMGRIYRAADHLVFPTDFARECLKKHLDNKPNTVISNGVDTSIFVPGRDVAFRAQHGIAEETYLTVYVGRLHPEKNVPTLIDAFVQVLAEKKDAQLWIVGTGHMEVELKEHVESLGLTSSVHFLGKVSNEDLIRVYHAADVFVLPSLAELEGMVVLEAMASGLPIIIADAEQSASRFFVRNNNGKLFPSFDTQALAQAILFYVDKEKREEAGKASRTEALALDIRESVKKLEDVYYSLL